MAILLIVDDEQNIRLLYQTELAAAGYTVETAGTVEQAKQAFAGSAIDLVVLDLKLTPEDGGLETLKWMREKDRRIPIIINTAFPTYKADFSSWLADAYIVKSSSLDELKATIAQLLKK